VQAIFLDIETNGLDFYTHRVLDIALQLICLKTGELRASLESKVYINPKEWTHSDPQSLEINGCQELIHNHKALKKEEVAELIKRLFIDHQVHRDTSVYICQNPSFDRPFFAQLIKPYEQESLGWPYRWLDLASMFWARRQHYTIKISASQLSKDAIAHQLSMGPESVPHRAMRGVEHLVACYERLIGWST
jgi:oligoribonuclease